MAGSQAEGREVAALLVPSGRQLLPGGAPFRLGARDRESACSGEGAVAKGMQIAVKRAYDDPAPADGQRILVDRVWPRGVRKAELGHDAWLKDLAPSRNLRKWFGHDPDRWAAFQARYFRELDDASEAVGDLLARARQGKVTLLFAAKDEDRNNAVALKHYLERHDTQGDGGR